MRSCLNTHQFQNLKHHTWQTHSTAWTSLVRKPTIWNAAKIQNFNQTSDNKTSTSKSINTKYEITLGYDTRCAWIKTDLQIQTRILVAPRSHSKIWRKNPQHLCVPGISDKKQSMCTPGWSGDGNTILNWTLVFQFKGQTYPLSLRMDQVFLPGPLQQH